MYVLGRCGDRWGGRGDEDRMAVVDVIICPHIFFLGFNTMCQREQMEEWGNGYESTLIRCSCLRNGMYIFGVVVAVLAIRRRER